MCSRTCGQRAPSAQGTYRVPWWSRSLGLVCCESYRNTHIQTTREHWFKALRWPIPSVSKPGALHHFNPPITHLRTPDFHRTQSVLTVFAVTHQYTHTRTNSPSIEWRDGFSFSWEITLLIKSARNGKRGCVKESGGYFCNIRVPSGRAMIKATVIKSSNFYDISEQF